MRIILVGNTSWSMIKFRKGLIHKLIEEGYELYILAPRDDYTPQLENTGAYYQHIDIDNKGANPIKDALLAYHLYRHYRRINPDLIIHYTIKPNIYGTLAAKYANKYAIAVVTGLGYTFLNNSPSAKMAKILYKFSFRYAKQVWFINCYDMEHFLDRKLVNNSNIKLLPGEGVDTKAFAPRPKKQKSGQFRFALIARLLWDKGVGEYVKAAKELKNRYSHISFDLVGFLDSQNPQAISKEQVAFWVKEGYINYIGPLQDVRDYLADCDCLVLPSYREGLSMILMEAAAMEVPIITCDVPGCKELVQDGISGLLCTPKSYQSLKRQMEYMLQLSEKERKQMGKAGRRLIVENYDERIVLDHYLSLIRELVPATGDGFELITGTKG